MIKELVISIIIVGTVFIGNNITENYTKDSIEEIIQQLYQLKNEIIKKDKIDYNLVKEKMDTINEKWEYRYGKLAYYIEHDELEKVKTELTGLMGYIEKEEYNEAIPEVNKSVYILEHIKEKTAINLKNIF